MNREKKEKHFIGKPVYVGGPAAMKKFIADHLKYPDQAALHKIEGTVYLKFTIDYKGIVISSKIISGIGHGCDEEAKRLVSLLKFKVKKPRGTKVKFHKNIQIHFRLPKPEAIKPQYNYILKETSNEVLKENPAEEKSYNYTIKF